MIYKSDMWEAIRCRPITLISATFSSTDGELHQNVISGPKPASSCLPEEGLYILHGNRGLQIASVCDLRKCYRTQVCHCAEQQQQQHLQTDRTTASANTRKKRESTRGFARVVRERYALSWLDFYKAAEVIRSLRFCFLAHPRTLSWDEVFGTQAFYFDSDLEEHYTSTRSYECIKPASRVINEGLKEYPGGLIDCIGDAWREFLEYGGYDFRPVTPLPERTRSEEEEVEEDDYRADDIELDISEWDDTDSPIHGHDPPSTAPPDHSRKRPRPEDDFDLIDDLIEEEFPRLKRVLQEPRQNEGIKEPHPTPKCIASITHKTKDVANSTATSNSTEAGKDDDRKATTSSLPEGPPAPVIIPPRDMFIGQGLTFCSFRTRQGLRGCGDGYGLPGDSRAAADMWVSTSC
ncbi:hypothetical protein GGR51DRAFT_575624 [Nemania sp. FL0031]|nr:hypothetical protein GGR51DRAFT_575624 [Nemania sp. FL0031]